MTGRPARRPPSAAPLRRTRPVKRASAGLSPVRAGAALTMLLAAGATYGVGASSAFDFARLEIAGTEFTDRAAVEEVLDEVRGENLFRLSTVPVVAALRELPTVADAGVAIALPETLAITIVEREPILVWAAADRRFLSDLDGLLFAELGADAPAAADALPVVDDRRGTARLLAVGSTLDPVDLDAARRLGSLVPSDVGSTAPQLGVVVTDEHGFVVTPGPDTWRAVFGFYTASLRRTDIIPGQVRLLRSLLLGREPTIDRIILADEQDGTFTRRATPRPSDEPEP